MTNAVGLASVRPCRASDDALLYDVFCTTWRSEVAALPNQNLAQHVLRIQHIAQERRLESTHPGMERFVVLTDHLPAGRLYLDRTGARIEVLDLTLLERFRGEGVGTRLLAELFDTATHEARAITLRVPRRHERVTGFYLDRGFALTAVDDLDNTLVWTPARVSSH